MRTLATLLLALAIPTAAIAAPHKPTSAPATSTARLRGLTGPARLLERNRIQAARLPRPGAAPVNAAIAARQRAVDNGLATADPVQREQMLVLGRAGTTMGHWFVRWLVLNYTVANALSTEAPSSYRRYASPEGDYSLIVFKDGSGTLIDDRGFASPEAPAQAAKLAQAWSKPQP